jgi:expansin (peptidoglycan-binding protein)
MSAVTTTRLINLGQLAAEMAGKPLSALGDQGTTTVTCHDPAVTQAALQAAINAHVAIDEQANRATLEQQAATALTGNRDFLALASPTNAQVVAQVKALTRQNNGVIRLILGRLDGTF